MGENKKCFIITPIGNPKTDVREKADGVINAIIKPVLIELGYEAIPPHEMSDSGSITQKIIEHIINDDLVISNLTGLNANVMYELAIRHAVRKPIVCIIERNTPLPFDVATERFIFYDDNFSNVLSLKNNIKKAVIAAINETEIDNPIYRSIKEVDIIKRITENQDPNSNILKLILSRLSKIESCVSNSNPFIINENSKFNEGFYAIIKLGNNEITSGDLSKINSSIAKRYIQNGITVAIIYDSIKNEIIIENGNTHESVLDAIVLDLELTFSLDGISYELHPF